MLKTPKFWTEKNLISYALLPLSWLYFAIFSLLKIGKKPQKIATKVICIGNVKAGGSGKTPTALALGHILQEMQIDFAYLSRGYRGAENNILLEKDGNYDAEKVGDEPLLLAEIAPTMVAKDRFFGARELEKSKKPQVILLDDGMQNQALHYDYTILVVDGKIGFGNELLIPAGPMREPLKQALKRVDLVVIIGKFAKEFLTKFPGKKIVTAHIVTKNLNDFLDKKLVAFCGLAYPKKFFSILEESGLRLVQTQPFPDHHIYTKSDLRNLLRIARKNNANLITTKKDWVKFSPTLQKKISYLDIELKFDDETLIKNELKAVLQS
jgi:tetraacyldisaccharide 4'-kinase